MPVVFFGLDHRIFESILSDLLPGFLDIVGKVVIIRNGLILFILPQLLQLFCRIAHVLLKSRPDQFHDFVSDVLVRASVVDRGVHKSIDDTLNRLHVVLCDLYPARRVLVK